jgi:phospholipid/cholesterol/gamma-HCH transport system permease protein
LRLAGDWRVPRIDGIGGIDHTEGTADRGASGAQRPSMAAPLPSRLPSPLPSPLAAGAQVDFDSHTLAGWDSSTATRLWALTETLRQAGASVQLDGLPAGLREVLTLAMAPAAVPAEAPTTGQATPAAPQPAPPATGPWAQAAITATFLGDVLIALGRWLRGRSALRRADVLQQLDLAGPRSLPIVLLTCGLIGLMLAYMGGAQLGRIGAQNFLADVVTVGMVRELGGLMTGIILAGRVGSAFAAQLATMEAGEEIDALRVLGIDPITHLVLPRLLALALVAPALIGFGALAGVLAGWPAAVGAYGVTSAEYFHQCLRALNGTHLGIGLFKGLLYAALAALAGCREGLHAGRSAQAVGAATTAAVVKALVWIVAAACGSTVLFTSLGY